MTFGGRHTTIKSVQKKNTMKITIDGPKIRIPKPANAPALFNGLWRFDSHGFYIDMRWLTSQRDTWMIPAGIVGTVTVDSDTVDIDVSERLIIRNSTLWIQDLEGEIYPIQAEYLPESEAAFCEEF